MSTEYTAGEGSSPLNSPFDTVRVRARVRVRVRIRVRVRVRVSLLGLDSCVT